MSTVAPFARVVADPRPRAGSRPHASVIIPAHNEGTVIGRALDPLARAAAWGDLEVIVVCNGCDDDTARRAASVAGVVVLETPVASKARALNLGDRVATAWPRVYLDADVEASEHAVRALAQWLGAPGRLAARPPARYAVDGADALVRAYYRARARIPSLHAAMWGAGVYALSYDGHSRLGAFPEVTADDLWVDRLFDDAEKAVIDAHAVTVQAPRRLGALLAITRRAARGAAAAAPDGTRATTAGGTVRELLRSVHGPRAACDAAVYALVAGLARLGRGGAQRWERDDSSR